MSKEMLINVSEGEECRIALVEDGRLEELYMERTSSTSHVGNVYKGKVTNVEPSIQAAFVDFGLGRNGFLHISDLMPTYFGGKAEDVVESVGRKMARRDRPPIQKCLRRGDEIIVQIIKEGIGTKGPTLSTYVSIPGRILVMMPGMSKLGVSRKIEDEEERKRLRQILDGLKPPKDCGFIIRTAGVGKSKTEIDRDLKYLTRLFETINKKAKSTSGPVELYAEGDLVTRTVRDVMTSDVERIVVDNDDVAKKIKEFFKLVAPRTKNKVDLYDEPVPLFHKYGIEKEIELMYSRHVPLPSGGSLVIDSTEAIVAIDVNSGKFRDHSDAETTAFKTDMEAAEEIPRQLRLRDLGGVIICDFIDLRYERHRRDLEKLLHDNLNRDRAKTKMLRMSQFGIIEMTRQRMRPSLKRSIYNDCPHCKGAGLVKTPESMSLDVMRRLAIGAHDERVVRLELAVCNEVAFYLQNKKRAQLATLENEAGKRIIIRGDAALGLDEHRLELFDARDGRVFLPELGMSPADPQQQQQRGGHPQHVQQGRGGRGGRDDRRGGGGGGGRDDRGGREARDDRREGGRGGRDQQRNAQGRGGGRDRHRDERPAEDRYVESVEDQVDERETEREEQAVADASLDAPLSPPQEVAHHDETEEYAGAPSAAAYDERGRDDQDDEDTGPAEAPGAIEDEEPEFARADAHGSGAHEGDDDDDESEESEQADDDTDAGDEQGRQPQGARGPATPPARQQPAPAQAPPHEDYEDEIELQPHGITHERPNPKDQRGRGGRGGGRGGRGGAGGGRGGRGGRGGPVQQKVDLGPPPKRGENEMSLAERFAMELAAEKAQRRQPQGGGNQGAPSAGGNRPQTHQGGGQQQHRQGGGGGGQQHRQGGGGGQNRPQQQHQNRQGGQSQQHRQGGGGHQGRQGQGGQQQHRQGGQGQQGPGGQQPQRQDAGEGEGGARRGGRRRRRGRGGRAGNDGGDTGGNQGGGDFGHGEGHGQRESASAPAEPQQASMPSPQPAQTPRPPVQRTGSTDRHLLHDQPVMPQPVSRPRTYRDLDEIPDDLD